MSKPKVVFFGTSYFALPVLEVLFRIADVRAVVTAPDEPKAKSTNVIAEFARINNITLMQPRSLKNEASVVSGQLSVVDLAVVAAYGKIIPQSLIDMPNKGMLNVHPSLLPKYRGPSPVQYALLNNETETGVTIIKLDSEVDHGPIVAQVSTPIKPDWRFHELNQHLWAMGSALLADVLAGYVADALELHEQNHDEATFSKILKKSDGEIDLAQSASKAYAQYRAFHEWPGLWMKWNGKMLKILRCKISANPNDKLLMTNVLLTKTTNSRLLLKTVDVPIEIFELQPEGKRPMTASEFINGYLRNN